MASDPRPGSHDDLGGVGPARHTQAPRRADLQAFLSDWLPAVAMLARARRPQVRWQIEVDPQQI